MVHLSNWVVSHLRSWFSASVGIRAEACHDCTEGRRVCSDFMRKSTVWNPPHFKARLYPGFSYPYLYFKLFLCTMHLFYLSTTSTKSVGFWMLNGHSVWKMFVSKWKCTVCDFQSCFGMFFADSRVVLFGFQKGS